MTTQTLSERQEGILEGLREAEKIARLDLRVDIAKDCGYEPSWQKGRWMVADELSDLIGKLVRDDGVSANAREGGK